LTPAGKAEAAAGGVAWVPSFLNAQILRTFSRRESFPRGRGKLHPRRVRSPSNQFEMTNLKM
jgi:hypothetical protein